MASISTTSHLRLENTTTSLDRSELISLIEDEARLLGLSGEDVITKVKSGHVGHGYIWDDLSLLVALLAE